MTNPIDTSKNARDMNEQEKRAFLEACRKLDVAPPKPVETTTRTARDMTPEQRAAWFQEHRRKFS
jgi:hypothetical protein